MDVITKSILYYIQSREGTKNAILAGGAVRDEIYKLPIKDYDIFIPSNKRAKTSLIKDIIKEFSIKTTVVDKAEDYEGTVNPLDSVNHFTHEGRVYELITVDKPDDEEFANSVINEFDYGVNMCYSDGSYVADDNEFFKEDRDYDQMSLINLRKISELPKAMDRYNKFYNKCVEAGRHTPRFRAPALRMVKEDTHIIPVRGRGKSYLTAGMAAAAPVWNEIPPAQAAPWNPVAPVIQWDAPPQAPIINNNLVQGNN